MENEKQDEKKFEVEKSGVREIEMVTKVLVSLGISVLVGFGTLFTWITILDYSVMSSIFWAFLMISLIEGWIIANITQVYQLREKLEEVKEDE